MNDEQTVAGFFVRKNQRAVMRRALPIKCQVVRESDFSLVAERALDVSPDGMLVESAADLRAGEKLIVTFRATDLGIWFDTEATVRRVVRGRRPGDRGPGLGLSFDTLDRVHRFILKGHLRRYAPPLPKRAQRIDFSRTIRMLSSLSARSR